MSPDEKEPNNIKRPSLNIVRPVINLPDGFQDDLRAEMDRYDIPRNNDSRLFLSEESVVSLVSDNEVLNLYDKVGEEPTTENLDELIEHLRDELPESFDDIITLSLNPLRRDLYWVRKRSSRPNSPKTEKAVFRSEDDIRLTKERAMARQVLNRYFGISDPSASGNPEIWCNRNTGMLKFASTVGKDHIIKLTRFCEESEKIPNEVTLDSASIDDA
jgi:hypothetical protein